MTEAKEVKVTTPKKTVIINKYTESGGWIYLLGGIGAFIYYIQGNSGIDEIIIALLKSLAWPAFLVYHVLGL